MLPGADGLSASAGRLESGVCPETPDDALDDRFVEACQMIDYIKYLADILTVGDLEERVAVVDELMKGGARLLSFGTMWHGNRKEGVVPWEEG